MRTLLTLCICFCVFVANAQEVWTQKENFPTVSGISGRENYASFAIGNKIYVGMGTASQGTSCGSATSNIYKDWYAYDPTANTWTRVADFPGEGRYNGFVSFAIGGKGYFGLGYGNATGEQRDFWEYNPATNTWTRKTDFPYKASFSTGYAIGTKGYVVGGTIIDPVSGVSTSRATVNFEYDPSSNTWTAKAALPVGRERASAFVIGAKGYVGLGQTASGYANSFAAFDPATNTWSSIASYPGTPRIDAAGFTLGGYGYIIGGNDGSGSKKEVYKYDTSTDAWEAKTNYPGNYVSLIPWGGNRQDVVNNKFYFGLGYITNSSYVCGTYTYTYSCGSWWSSRTCTGTGYYYNYTYSYSNQWWEFSIPVSITTDAVTTAVCEGAPVSVPFTVNGTITAGNVFTAQLSDATGSFASPVNIGTVTGTTSGTIAATLPKGTKGTGYRIRVVASTPSVIGTDNGTNITINPLPVMDYTVSGTTQCIGTDVSLTNATTGAASYEWNFGDGSTATTADATHGYATAGTYTVKQIATTSLGCKDSVSKTITVNPKPTPAFTISNTGQCVNDNVFTFKSTSSISSGTLTYNWSFGNGATSTVKDPTHTYTVAGTYNVKLVVTSDKGCKDSVSQSVTVYPKPTPAFTINTPGQCIYNNNFVLTNTSSITTGTLSYKWNFGDGSSATTTNASHTYTTPGTYTIKLVVTSNNTCKDSVSKTVTVYPNPQPAYTINDAAQCLTGNNYTFTNASTGASTYQWQLGDGSTTAGVSPSHSYLASGSYTTKLIAISAKGCKDSVSQNITVYPDPTPDFTINNTEQCITGNNFLFTNTSTISTGALTYQWNFGDGSTSTTTNATHAYTAAGVYTVKLVVTSANGCEKTLSKTVTVYPKPNPAFTSNNTSQCFTGNNFTFTNASTIASGTMNYQWNFGDGTTATTTNASHSYAAPGTYTVKLVATSDKGCQEQFATTVTVNPGPVALFATNTLVQCLNANRYVFTNQSAVTSGTLTHEWNFGDGTTAILASPTHTYTTAGTYTVSLVVTTSSGCKNSYTQTVTVIPKPVAAFTVNDAGQCITGNQFVFTNTSSTVAGSLTYLWNFGDGTTSTDTNPVHVYSAPGTYTVKLVVTGASGCTETTTRTVVVYPKPTPAFTVNNSKQCLNENRFEFSNTSTITVGTMSYLWKFGDGTTSTLQNPNHVYGAPGVYTVKLIVTSNQGCKDSLAQTIEVSPKPIPGFTINQTAQCQNENRFVFTNTSIISAGSLTYVWTFGDGTTVTTANALHTYTTPGVYAVKLVVTSDNGCKDSIEQNVTIYPKPEPAFVVNEAAQCLTGNTFAFTNASTIKSGTITYVWTFGDGTSSTEANPVHTYAATGTYTVKLVVTSANDCKDSVEKQVSVYPKPAPSFAINTALQCLTGNNFVFTNTSSIASGTLSHAWYFGDGVVATTASPTHSYTTPGTYAVKLVTTSDNGCKDSIEQTVTVYPKPVPSFTINNANQCIQGNSFAFTNTTGSTGTLTYQWQFGDGATTATADAAHVYATPGSYVVKLIVTNENGCTETTTQTITVFAQPAPSFTVNQAAQCLADNQFVLTNTSTITTGSLTYVWDFGDGNRSTQQNPTHVYSTAGTYIITLTTTSDKGCVEQSKSTITVYDKPVADFVIGALEQCFNNNQFHFNNTSQNTTPVNYTWSFGDGTESNAVNANKRYSAVGNYSVKLVAVNAAGCASDAAQKNIVVHPHPQVSVSADKLVLEGKNVVLESSVVGSDVRYHWTPNRYFSSSNTIINPVVAPKDDIVYTLTVTGRGNCASSDQVMIKVLKKPVIPNVFSPNNDGVNDVWEIKHLNYYPGCTVEVYSRNGQLVYRSQGYAVPWDGKYKGQSLPVGTYYYVIDPKNGQEKAGGSITILR